MIRSVVWHFFMNWSTMLYYFKKSAEGNLFCFSHWPGCWLYVLGRHARLFKSRWLSSHSHVACYYRYQGNMIRVIQRVLAGHEPECFSLAVQTIRPKKTYKCCLGRFLFSLIKCVLLLAYAMDLSRIGSRRESHLALWTCPECSQDNPHWTLNINLGSQ